MATRSTTPARRAVRSLAWLLAIVVALGALLGAGTLFWGWKWAPQLGLDLQGGTEIILTPQLASGSQTVTPDQLNQAVSIIRQRVDAAGVSEAEISTQGVNNIVVSLPGTPDEATLKRIQASAKLDFRAVLLTSAATASASVSPSATPTAGSTPSPTPTLNNTPTAKPTNGSDLSYVTPFLQNKYDNFNCSTLS
ncbi:MAG: protein translocase subunit SecD, partial [Actinomycetota bacterium]|nr:protein translocase subunit SecD [Actinomycetota bacterium]